MLDEFIEYYSLARAKCFRFANTLENIQFDEEQNSPEVYTLTSINLTTHNCNSIAVLLKEDEFGNIFSICRNIMETFFNLHWAFELGEKEQVKERIFQLEATPYFYFENDINQMEKNQASKKPFWKKNIVKDMRELIEMEKKKFPFLLEQNKSFKRAPSFKVRMGEFYPKDSHVYSFTSLFTHPNPKLKELYLHRIVRDENPFKLIEEPLKQTLSYVLSYIESIIGYGCAVFNKVNLNGDEIRNECYSELESMVSKLREQFKGKQQ